MELKDFIIFRNLKIFSYSHVILAQKQEKCQNFYMQTGDFEVEELKKSLDHLQSCIQRKWFFCK